MRVVLAVIVTVGMWFGSVGEVQAQQCTGGSFTTADMAGRYVSQPNLMALVIEPCGHLLLVWDNAFGRHNAGYQAVQQLEGGGYIAMGVVTTDFYLDNQTAIGVSPAEPGWVKIITISPFGTDLRSYRLQKIS